MELDRMATSPYRAQRLVGQLSRRRVWDKNRRKAKSRCCLLQQGKSGFGLVMACCRCDLYRPYKPSISIDSVELVTE